MDQPHVFQRVQKLTQGIIGQPILEVFVDKPVPDILSLYIGKIVPEHDLHGKILEENDGWNALWYLDIQGVWQLYYQDRLYCDPSSKTGTFFERDELPYLDSAFEALHVTGFELDPDRQHTLIQLSNDYAIRIHTPPNIGGDYVWYLYHAETEQSVSLDCDGQYQHMISVGQIQQDSRTQQVTIAEKQLSPHETKALMFLLQHVGEVVDFESLATAIYEQPIDQVKKQIYQIMHRLRQCGLRDFLVNVPGQGYRLEYYVPPAVRVENNQLVVVPDDVTVTDAEASAANGVKLQSSS